MQRLQEPGTAATVANLTTVDVENNTFTSRRPFWIKMMECLTYLRVPGEPQFDTACRDAWFAIQGPRVQHIDALRQIRHASV